MKAYVFVEIDSLRILFVHGHFVYPMDYVNRHPEQLYNYYYYHNPIPNVSNLREILNCGSYMGSDKYRLSFLFKNNGYYDGFHILSTTTKGEYKIPRNWQTLKSYINGKETYLK